MNQTMERLEPNTPTMPISHILAGYFQKFIHYWSKGEVRYLGELREEPVDMPVELCVRWNGNARGMLVIRCYEEFVHWLSQGKGYKPVSFYTGKEIMNEMVSQYCVYLIHNFWRPELLEIGPIQPRASIPEDWPKSAPETAFSLLVEDHPVEIRFWINPEN
jgi:hypothetical protein